MGSAPLGSYTFRFEYVCLNASGCSDQKVSIRWADYRNISCSFDAKCIQKSPTSAVGMRNATTTTPSPQFDPIPGSVLLPTVSDAEQQRRALAQRLQNGWGTFSHKSMFTWVLLPESFAIKMSMFQLSTSAYLPTEGLTVSKTQLLPGTLGQHRPQL